MFFTQNGNVNAIINIIYSHNIATNYQNSYVCTFPQFYVCVNTLVVWEINSMCLT